MSEIKYGLICSECESSEVYYENATTGSGKYTCQDCGFMSLSVDDFKYAVPVKEFNDLQAKLEQVRRERDELSEKNGQLEYVKIIQDQRAVEARVAVIVNKINNGEIKFKMPAIDWAKIAGGGRDNHEY